MKTRRVNIIRSKHIRSKSIRSKSIRSKSIRSKRLRSKSIRSKRLRSKRLRTRRQRGGVKYTPEQKALKRAADEAELEYIRLMFKDPKFSVSIINTPPPLTEEDKKNIATAF